TGNRRTRTEMGPHRSARCHGPGLRCPRLREVCRGPWQSLGVLRQDLDPVTRADGTCDRGLRVGGILLVLGWATRWLGLLFAIEMLVATFWVQMPAKGWNGSELERMLLAGGI